jgi:hypothetical protein
MLFGPNMDARFRGHDDGRKVIPAKAGTMATAFAGVTGEHARIESEPFVMRCCACGRQ